VPASVRIPIVIVGGPPASGKTKLASRLAEDLSLPLISKDGIKEALFDAFGTRDRTWSQQLGRGAFAVIYHLLEAELAAGRSTLVEGNFRADDRSREFERLAKRFEFAPLQIHCRAPVDVLYARYQRRVADRHVGHADAERLGEIREFLDPDRYLLRLPGTLITLDTTPSEGFDYAAIRDAVAAHLAR
jgi:predicted kinase